MILVLRNLQEIIDFIWTHKSHYLAKLLSTMWSLSLGFRDLLPQVFSSFPALAKANSFEALKGHVEIDETFMGGHQPLSKKLSNKDKTVVLGMKQRGGRIVTEVIENTRRASVKPIILETIEEGATVSTDQLRSYLLLENSGYDHGHVNHEKEWANGIHHTNNLESFWNIFKNSVRGTHIHISKKLMLSCCRFRGH